MIALFAAALVATSSGMPAGIAVRPWLDAAIVASIGSMNAGAWALDRSNRSDPCPCDPASLPGVDRVAVGRHDMFASQASNDLQYGSILAAPILAFATDPGAPRDRAASALVAIEAMSLAGSTTNFLKSAIHRPRPPGYARDATPPFDYHSMPSGHATAAFSAMASATTLFALRHPGSRATKWIALGGFAVAASTAWFRVEAGRHFPSDVVAGAAIGTAAGVAVPLAHTHASFAAGPGGVIVHVRFGSVR